MPGVTCFPFQEISCSGMEEQIITESDGSTDSMVSWITWFHHLKGNEYFCPIDESFLLDKFNLTGLPLDTPLFKKHMIS